MTVHPRQAQGNDLCALQDVKDYVFRGGGNQTQTDDNLLQRLISAASQWIRKETAREFMAANVTETRSGTGGRIMFVRQPPIISVSSVYVNGNSIPAKSSNVADYLNSNGYSFSDDYISLFSYVFDRGLDNVVISYQGGFNSVPYDLEQACIEATSWAYRELDRLGHKSKSLAGETVVFETAALSERAQRALERYRKVIPI